MEKFQNLHVIVNFNKTPEHQVCPIDLSNISWGNLSENVLYCNFFLHDHKYIRINHSDLSESQYGKLWLTFKCEPEIYHMTETGEIVNLFEYDVEKYFKHKDYWCVNLQLEQPSGYNSYSIKVESLKYEYAIFVNIFKFAVFSPSNFYDQFTQLKKEMTKPAVVGYFYDPITTEIDLQHEEYSSVISEILNELEYEDDDEDEKEAINE
jgi:hypothetical protein